MDPFDDPEAVARYAETTRRLAPGLDDLHRMACVLIAERAPRDATVLVVGAGGGLELKAFAQAQPDWRFEGVDPSAAMLALARAMLGPLAARARLRQGYVDAAPLGPFDAAACLLTMHFAPIEERRRMLAEIRRRLKPGAPFVLAHHSFPQDEPDRALWLSRYAAFAAAAGVEPAKARSGAEAVGARLPILSPEQDEALLREAGFSAVALFYAAFTFRGWTARA